MTDEMLDLARAKAAKAQATNVELLKGTIEDIPLPDESVDVIISNCVINLSVNKPRALTEMFRVLKPGGRIGISDVVAEDHLTPNERAARGSYVGCIAGALSRTEYGHGLAAAGIRRCHRAVHPSSRRRHAQRHHPSQKDAQTLPNSDDERVGGHGNSADSHWPCRPMMAEPALRCCATTA